MSDFVENMSALLWSECLEDSDLLKKLYDVRNDVKYEKLQLDHNKLTSTPDLRTFRQFDSLKLLDLRYNKIREIDFRLIPCTVTQFHLSGNKLTSIGDLSCCTELKYLYASSNKISHVDWRNLPPTLTGLYLDNNQLVAVGDCSHCTQLDELYVHYNHISHIAGRNFPPALQWLYLYKNQLKTVDVSLCTQLKLLDLDNNPTLQSIQSLPNKDFDFSINSSVKVLESTCFHENTYNMLKKKCKELKWKLEQPPVEVLLQGLEAVLEYYTEKPIRTTHTR